MKKKSPEVQVHKHPHGARAVQVDGPDGSQVVACENLRVLITKQDGAWIAQGLEIDYAIDGESVTDVKKRFEDGLAMTIQSNLRVYNDLRVLLRVAPQDVWDEWNDARNTLRRFQHSTMMVTRLQSQQHLPFEQIVFLDASDTGHDLDDTASTELADHERTGTAG